MEGFDFNTVLLTIQAEVADKNFDESGQTAIQSQNEDALTVKHVSETFRPVSQHARLAAARYTCQQHWSVKVFVYNAPLSGMQASHPLAKPQWIMESFKLGFAKVVQNDEPALIR